MMDNEKIPTDLDVSDRSRGWRIVHLIFWFLFCAIFVTWGAQSLMTLPFTETVGNVVVKKFPLIHGLAWGLGLIVGLATFIISLPRLFVRVAPNALFVTQNLLASIFNIDVNVVYGPGLHPCFLWEGRSASGNISLEEATVTFDFTLSLSDGSLSGKAAYWLRPDHREPVKFLRSVASVAVELKTHILAEIQNCMADEDFRKTIVTTETSVIVKKLNQYLEAKLVLPDHEIEKRNAVIIAGAAIDELLPSEELLRTLSAVSEARAVRIGTANVLGYDTAEELSAALNDGRITQDDVKEARRAFQQISGNMDKVDRKEFDFNISGLTPEAATAIAAALQSPGVIALAASRVGGDNSKKGNR